LLSDGKVLVAGGTPYEGDRCYGMQNSELYDPATGKWNATSDLKSGRVFYTVTLMTDGRVLVAGGYDKYCNPMASAEIFDAVTGTWTMTANMNTSRVEHTATLLPNGSVLVTGSSDLLYSPTAVGSSQNAEIFK
jgi:hypothetical protein